MNEKDSENIDEIRSTLNFVKDRWIDLFAGNVEGSLNKKDSDNLKEIKSYLYFAKETGGHGLLAYQRKILEEIEWAKSMRFYQFVLLFIIAISTIIIAFKI
tara:strand:- start:191 stop:493 length:303 start_codon:yes stop_codon:yes gene_type:complete